MFYSISYAIRYKQSKKADQCSDNNLKIDIGRLYDFFKWKQKIFEIRLKLYTFWITVPSYKLNFNAK